MMSALLPLISEILPMIMPASANITRAKQLEPAHPTVEGPVIERPAVVGKCDRMCVSVLTARPHQNSTVRHNSEQDAIFYAVSGNGILAVSESVDSDPKNHELSPGDFAFVPAWTEHQIKNETDEDVVFLVIQSGPTPIRADLTDWGGDMVKSRK
ncbi:Cupin-2 domain-containing protein [Fusarium falciforme]|nr:Cupin-2 domain-containing protein [Fusarium falciforme]WAO93610.1 Cupin-2 domain-containing protein [Fusarium falciforme]